MACLMIVMVRVTIVAMGAEIVMVRCNVEATDFPENDNQVA